VRNLTGTELKRLHREWRRRTDARLALVLDGVQNPYNLGSILRSAAAFGVDHLWLVGATAPPAGAKTQKTALGSQRYLTWDHAETFAEAAPAVRADGYAIVGIELAEGAVPLHELALPDDVALVIGHEDRGLSREGLAGCDHLAYLPQVGKIGSLNVATAASIALYEVRRRHWTTVEP